VKNEEILNATAARQTISPHSPIRTVLFDLDGTLADTAPDLAHALNALLQEQGRPPLPFESIRPVVSHGATALVRLGFGMDPAAQEFPALRSRLLDLYQRHLARETRLFRGIPELLTELERRDLVWGVVTNKPSFLTQPLMAALGLHTRAACIVCGDTTANKKPHPEPMLHACHLVGSRAAHCLFVGDAERDIRAGRSAGMLTLVALFGYIGAEDRPDTWGADGLITDPAAVLSWL